MNKHVQNIYRCILTSKYNLHQEEIKKSNSIIVAIYLNAKNTPIGVVGRVNAKGHVQKVIDQKQRVIKMYIMDGDQGTAEIVDQAAMAKDSLFRDARDILEKKKKVDMLVGTDTILK